MKTFLAQNAFISNSDAVIPISAPDTAVAPKPHAPTDAAAVLLSPDVHIAPHNSGEREPVSDAGLPPGGSSSSGDLRASSLRAGEDEPLRAHSPGESSSDRGVGRHAIQRGSYGSQVGIEPGQSEASAAIDPVREPVAAVDLQALWDCITDDRIVLIGREGEPEDLLPMFLRGLVA